MLTLAAAVVLMVACGGDDGPPSVTDPMLRQGQEVYRANCAACHGGSGQGGVGPRLAGGRVVERYPDIDDHIQIVLEGRGAMPAWEGRLSRQEIEAVVEYERRDL